MATIVHVPDGHTVQIHPPGVSPQPGLPAAPSGVIHDPAREGAMAAMNAALPIPSEKTTAPAAAKQPERKKKPAAAAPKKQNEKNEGAAKKGTTPR